MSITHAPNNKVSDTMDFESTNGKIVTTFVDSPMQIDRGAVRKEPTSSKSHNRKNHEMFNSNFGIRA